MVELAMVALMLLTLAAAAFDLGMAWRSGLATNESVRTGARVASAMGSDRLADYYALSGAKSALAASGKLDDVQRVVIYRSTAVNGQVPASCTAATPSGSCTVLSGAQLRSAFTTASFDAQGCFTGAAVKAWCPTTRNNVQLTADYFGIWIQIRHSYAFPILGAGTNVARDAVMRLEP
ncbi:MAG TPA: TadE/TadG family type IV pilus assembly protein [Aquihabitans sp.]|jgi:hypothetical protein|nr:TadE/TadG family type IV pilus assembly protein [Aquihabitans sp.]